jgi:hypothetical protein
MLYEYGTTRVVFFCGNFAIKFLRFRPFRIINRFLHWRKRGAIVEQLVSIDPSIPVAAVKYITGGLRGNLEERRFYKEHPELPLAPTLFTFLGLVNIQRRGEKIEESDLFKCPFREFAHLEKDLRKVEHFGWIDGKIHLLDYGTVRVNDLIAQRQTEELAVELAHL